MRQMGLRRRLNGGSKLQRKHRAMLMMTAAAGSVAAVTTTYSAMAEPVAGSAYEQAEDMEARRPAALLTTSDELRKALMDEEGVRYTVYIGAAGNPTVGIGHLVTPADGLAPGDRIGKERVLELFRQDLERAEQAVQRLAGDLPLSQHEFDALVDLAFNVGEGQIMPGSSPRLNRAFAAGDYDAIAQELDYSVAGGRQLDALAERSERRMQIFTEGEYEAPIGA